MFDGAEALLRDERNDRAPLDARANMMRRIQRAFAVHRSGIASLPEQFLTLEDFLAIRRRMIGIGSVGGKTLGMLVSRAVLREHAPDLAARLEVHDSFFVGAEVFVTYLIENDVWWLREKQKNPESF